MKYKIYFIVQGVVQIKYFDTPERAYLYKEYVQNSLGINEVSNVIEVP